MSKLKITIVLNDDHGGADKYNREYQDNDWSLAEFFADVDDETEVKKVKFEDLD